MTARTESSYERGQRFGRAVDALRRSNPEPMATPEQVLEISRRTCGADPGTVCDTGHGQPSLLWVIFPGFGPFHTRRYQDRSGDRR